MKDIEYSHVQNLTYLKIAKDALREVEINEFLPADKIKPLRREVSQLWHSLIEAGHIIIEDDDT